MEYEVRTGLKGEELQRGTGGIRRGHLSQRRQDHRRSPGRQPPAEGDRPRRRRHRQHRQDSGHAAGHRRDEHAHRQHGQHGGTHVRPDAGPVPQRRSGLSEPVEGRWDRKPTWGPSWPTRHWASSGLGRIGQEVAARAMAFDMRVIGFDPFLSAERAGELGIEPVAAWTRCCRASIT